MPEEQLKPNYPKAPSVPNTPSPPPEAAPVVDENKARVEGMYEVHYPSLELTSSFHPGMEGKLEEAHVSLTLASGERVYISETQATVVSTQRAEPTYREVKPTHEGEPPRSGQYTGIVIPLGSANYTGAQFQNLMVDESGHLTFNYRPYDHFGIHSRTLEEYLKKHQGKGNVAAMSIPAQALRHLAQAIRQDPSYAAYRDAQPSHAERMKAYDSAKAGYLAAKASDPGRQSDRQLQTGFTFAMMDRFLRVADVVEEESTHDFGLPPTQPQSQSSQERR